MKFNVLGPVTVVEGADHIDIGGPKQRAVLAILIAHAGKPVSNDAIAEDLYGDNAADRGRRRVQTYVSILRSALGEVITREGDGWSLRVERDQIDAFHFEDLYESVRKDPSLAPESAGTLLRGALSIWRGHPYGDIESKSLLHPEVTRLRELRLAAQMARIEADLESGRHDDLIGEIEGLISENPFQERLRAQHMLALYRAGRQKEALRSYQQMRTLLVDELGVDPTPELRDLEQRILEQDSSLDLVPRLQIERKAVLVTDLGDPLEFARLPTSDRERLLTLADTTTRGLVAEHEGARVVPAGTASYIVFDSVASASLAAIRLYETLGESRVRVAIDFGDVQVSDVGVSGAPVARAATLVAVANPGQVLLSPDAQHAVLTAEETAGMRFESLGTFTLPGIQGPTSIYQLLVGDPTRRFPPLDPSRIPPPLPDGNARSLPGYELREQIGTGTLGPIYRAYQPGMGREVLVEVVGRAEASDPDFIRSFEPDAQRLALLDHPNINPLIDYWREPSGAFLVYRHHRGGLLSDAESVTDPTRLVVQIGSALEYAHSYGVIHGSVRPDLVILDELGNGYLMGFPLAGVPSRSSPDHAAYIAPETLAGEKPSAATDVFALGVLAHELLGGRPVRADEPLQPRSRAEARAISELPGARYHTVAEFLRDLIPDSEGRGDRFTKVRNPYKGLAAFHESDSGEFFGRSAIVDELVDGLRRSRFLAVVGPSGIGKSSVVRAGLVPALRQGAIAGSEGWLITDMFPGSRPFHELSRSLERVTIDMPANLREHLADEEPDALAGLEDLLPSGASLLILIDQFEELFTMTSEATASRFLALLVRTIEAHHARIVVTIRADFLDRPLLYSEFGDVLRESLVVLRAPSQVELREAIVKPAEGVGIGFDPAVAELMISEVHDRPGALPLVQDALFELFDSRTSDTIDLDVYQGIGGVTGSISRRAEAIYSRLDPEQQATIQQVFLRLVTVAEDAAPTRRRIRLTELSDLGDGDVIDVFARHRLLVFDSDPITRAPTVELAHETLLTHWPRLAAWVDSAREDLVLSRRLLEAIDEWEASARGSAYLLTGARLAQHQAWTSTTNLALTGWEKDFLAASSDHDAELRARSRRRRGWIMGGFAAAALVAMVFGLIAQRSARIASVEAMASDAIVALETDPELSVLLAAEAFHRAPVPSTEAALHQALQRHRALMIIPTPDGWEGASGIADPAGERVAVAALNTGRLQMWEIGGDEPMWETTLADDGVAGFRSYSHLWFSADGSRLYVPLSLDFPRDSDGVGLYTVDADTGETVDFLRFPCLVRAMPAGGHFAESGAPWAFDWNKPPGDGGCEPSGSGLVDIDSGEILFQVPMEPGRPPTLSEDGRYLGTVGWFDGEENARTRVFDTTDGRIVFEFESPLAGGESNIVLSRDGSRALVGQNPTFLYDIATGERLQTYQGEYIRIRFTPDETRVFGTGLGPAIPVFDTETGRELIALRGHTSWAATVAVNQDGSVLVSSSTDSIRVWDITSTMRGDLPPIDLQTITDGQFMGSALTGSDRYLLVRRGSFEGYTRDPYLGSQPHRVDILDSEAGSLVSYFNVWYAELGPHGMLFVQPIVESGVTTPSGIEDAVRIGSPRLIDAASGETIIELDGCEWYWISEVEVEAGTDCGAVGVPRFHQVSFAADGSTVLGVTFQGGTAVWDTGSGERIRTIEPTWDENLYPAFGGAAVVLPDGRRMIIPTSFEEVQAHRTGVGEAPVLHVVDVHTGAEVGTVEGYTALPFDWLRILESAPRAGIVIGADTELKLIDPDTLEATALTRPQGGAIDDVAVSPNGRLLATVGRDEFIVVWDLSLGSVVAEIPVVGAATAGLRGVAFADDETLVVAPEKGDQLLRFTLNSEVLLDLALASLNRGLRPEECATYRIDPCPMLEETRARS